MSKKRLRIHHTPLDNVVSNLRGEVGEIIANWVLWRLLYLQRRELGSGDPATDLSNKKLSWLNVLSARLYDDIIARLSELAEPKIGQLTFFFAVEKMNAFHSELKAFQRYIDLHEFRKKRNADIAHKVLPEKWSDHREIFIPYFRILRAIGMAIRLMKKIDRLALGPAAPYSWRRGRERRYDLSSPPRVAYLLMPHIRLSGQERCEIVRAEVADGRTVFTEVPTLLNGRPAAVLVAKEWGVLLLGNRLIALPEYPVQGIENLDFD